MLRAAATQPWPGVDQPHPGIEVTETEPAREIGESLASYSCVPVGGVAEW